MSIDVPSSPEYDDYKSHHHKKKRVGKACDSCRIKKTKCDGKKPCNKCITDNKICVFSEKIKSKDRQHPSGYVELLETRIDLLSKSLEKLIKLSTPHLNFLKEMQILEKTNIPINSVVSYLINKEGLLRNLPVEWENGALIAANLPVDDKGIRTAAKEFAEHSQNIERFRDPANSQFNVESNTEYEEVQTPSVKLSSNSGSLFQHVKREGTDDEIALSHTAAPVPHPTNGFLNSRTNSNETNLSIKGEDSISHSYLPAEMEHDSIPERNETEIESNNYPLDGFFAGGSIVSSSAMLNGGTSAGSTGGDMFSPIPGFESEHRNDSNLALPPTIGTRAPSFDTDTNSFYQSQLLDMFDNTTNHIWPSNSSVSSLTNKFENHGIVSPTVTTAGPHNIITGTALRSASSVTRAHSPKLKNNGHVQKPPHSHNHVHSRSNSSSNHTNEFKINKISSGSSYSTPTPETFASSLDSPSEYREFPFAAVVGNQEGLPSEAFGQHPNYNGLSIMDTENTESFLINNPFLSKSTI